MSGYKLYYFPARARAEICRLSFAAAKIDFEDVRLSGEEWWDKEKASEYRFRINSDRRSITPSLSEFRTPYYMKGAKVQIVKIS